MEQKKLTQEERDRLIGCYPFDYSSRTPEDRKALAVAALDDQALFEELLEQEDVRQILEEPGTKEKLLRVLPELE